MHKHYSYSISLLFLLILFSKWNSKCDSFCLTKRNPSNIRNRTFLSCPWGQEENGATEDEMVGWHHWLSGHAFEQTLGDSEGQGSLACCSPWARKESDTTEQLNWTEGEARILLAGLTCKRCIGLIKKLSRKTRTKFWSNQYFLWNNTGNIFKKQNQ